jgi:ankyrin repeat protein
MVKFLHPALLLKLLADAFLVTQLADQKAIDRVNGSKFRDELNELVAGNTLKNFKNIKDYLITQLTELDSTRFLGMLCLSWITFYCDFIKTKYIGKLNVKELHSLLLADACTMLTMTIKKRWHECDASTDQLVKDINSLWFLPDFQENKSGLGVLFNWLETRHNLTRYQIAKNYDDSKKRNSDNSGSALRSYWAQLSNIGEFAKANLDTLNTLEQAIWLSIKDKGLMNQKRLRLNLLLARGFDYLFIELQKNFTKPELVNAHSIPTIFSNWGKSEVYLEDNRLINLAKRTSVDRKKSDSDEKSAKELFEFFKNNPPVENLTGIVNWYRGRFYVLSGDLEEGLRLYKKAFDNLQFTRGGKAIEKIIVESLALSAFLGKDRRFFADIYYYAALIGLFDFPEEKELDYHFHQWSLAFNTYFSPHAYYPSVSKQRKEELAIQGSWAKGYLIDDIENAANKKSKTNLGVRPKTQLQWAINAPNKSADDVIALINQGANINQQNNSGGTALIEALQKYYGLLYTNKDPKALQIINGLLEQDVSKSIDCVSKGKGISALSLAIDAFDIEMINRLISKGADAKGRCHKPEMSYVYYTLNRYAWNQQMLSMQSSEQMIAMMASNNSGANPQFGATAQEQAEHAMQLIQDPTDKQIFDDVRECYSEAYQKVNATEDKTVALIKLLLENGASANGHFINDLTPLMFATELGLIRVVELFLEHKADIHAVNNCGKKAIDYAIGFNKPEIQNLLVSHVQ